MPFGRKLAKRILSRLHTGAAQLLTLLHWILAIKQHATRFGSLVPCVSQGDLGA